MSKLATDREAIRRLTPERFDGWIADETSRFRLVRVGVCRWLGRWGWIADETSGFRLKPIPKDDGHFELDRARRDGNLNSWYVQGQWIPKRKTSKAPVAVTSTGKSTLIQFDLKQLDSGRPIEEPRARLKGWCAKGLPELRQIYDGLWVVINENWPPIADAPAASPADGQSNENWPPIADAPAASPADGQSNGTTRRVREETRRRAYTFKQIKDTDTTLSYVQVAMKARERGYPDATEDDVRNDYRAMGWTWEPANKVR